MSSANEREERIRSHERESGRNQYDHGYLERPQSYRDRPTQRPRYNNDSRYNDSGYSDRKPYNDRRPYSRDTPYHGSEPKDSKPPQPKEKPNFKPSGLLAKESNNIKGIQLKYTEPEDSAKPLESPMYYFFIFKKGSNVPREYRLNTKSYHLIGRDDEIVDLGTDHESCSKQHAVIQFRSRPTVDDNGNKINQIKPYIIDLESSNGTFLNNDEIPTSRFIELQAEDTIRFGDSETDHVLVIGE